MHISTFSHTIKSSNNVLPFYSIKSVNFKNAKTDNGKTEAPVAMRNTGAINIAYKSISTENDTQLQNFISIPKTFIPFLQGQNTQKAQLVEKFLKSPKDVEVKKIAVSANAALYMVSDGQNQIAVKM